MKTGKSGRKIRLIFHIFNKFGIKGRVTEYPLPFPIFPGARKSGFLQIPPPMQAGRA
ncbi:MAG: hypothetical protein ACTTJV_06215 [Ottowia sp.]